VRHSAVGGAYSTTTARTIYKTRMYSYYCNVTVQSGLLSLYASPVGTNAIGAIPCCGGLRQSSRVVGRARAARHAVQIRWGRSAPGWARGGARRQSPAAASAAENTSKPQRACEYCSPACCRTVLYVVQHNQSGLSVRTKEPVHDDPVWVDRMVEQRRNAKSFAGIIWGGVRDPEEPSRTTIRTYKRNRPDVSCS
jgi:hypothetical protein